MNKVLVIEDELNLLETIKLNLQLEGFDVQAASRGDEALDAFKLGNPDLVLLDVMLPGINGFDLCAQFKTLRPEIPVIFLTAKSGSVEKIAGLKLGADDYITKPFELEELLLRIQNVLKRNPRPEKDPVFYFGDNKIDFSTYEIIAVNGGKLTISKREIALLKLLTDNVNRVVSRDEIIEKLWDKDENPSARTIDNYILNFRKWFEVNPKEPHYFQSIRGVGYKFTG
ncbi:MAG: response regulator transcription factor [Bacteroidetes bacterium]|nr:response regulator transcription factor [Bacteroidota bacterium]